MQNKKWRVLIVDDEFRIGRLIKKLIHWDEFALECVDVVDNGGTAFEIIQSVRCPDVVITDKMAGEENAYQLFETAGQAMLMSMGGASGVIFGSLYLAGAKGMDPKSVITSKDLADMEKKSLEAIQERGGAQVGDKTMVDALSPAVDALAANADKGLLEMLKAAEASAKQGVEDTKKYVAKFGRAKSLLERAIGHQDAGATSVYLIFQGMREFVEGKLA